MSNFLVQDKPSYIRELQSQINSKPSKMDLYKAKLSEREFDDKSNMFNTFGRGRGGGGEPLRDEKGNIVTARRTSNYNEPPIQTLPSPNDQFAMHQPPPLNYQPNPQYEYQHQPQQGMPQGMQQGGYLRRTPSYPQQIYLPPQPSPYQSRPVSYHPPPQQEAMNPYYNQPQQSYYIDNPYLPPQQALPPQPNASSRKMNTARQTLQNGAPQYSNDNGSNGLGILPQDRPNDKLEIQKKILREDWFHQIEEKKKKAEEEKRKKLEEDQKEEGRWRQYIEDQKKRERELAIKKATESFSQPPLLQQQPQQSSPSQPKDNSTRVPQSTSQQEQAQGQDHSFQMIKPQSEPPQSQYERMLNMNYANLGKTLDDNIQAQIAKLRVDVNTQYIEMSEMFGKLKMDVSEANQLKAEAERELQYIKDELLKQKMQNILYETKLNNVLEKNAPYNNLHIPLNEVDPMYNAYNQKPLNLKSTSDMVYANDMVDERATNRTKQLSNLAQVGQSLVGESEFVPILDNTREKKDTAKGKRSENAKANCLSSSKGDNLLETAQDESIKVLDSFMKKGEYHEMYEKLSDIATINHQIDPLNKCNTLTKNLEIDYKMLGNNQRNDEEIKKLDDMLSQLVENTNQD